MSAPAIISSGTAAGGPPVGGSGTTGTIPVWSSGTTLGDSLLTQSGTTVRADTATEMRLGNTGTTNRSFTVYSNDGSARQVAFGSNLGGATPQHFIYATGAYPLTFATNGTERARIDSSGRLLVGTATSPSRADAMQVIARAGVPFTYLIDTTANRGVYQYASSSGTNSYWELGELVGPLGSETLPVSYLKVNGNTKWLEMANSGWGLKLPATPGNGDANTLDAYRDGGAGSGGVAFTATLEGTGTNPTTPVTATGEYVLVGRQITLYINFVNVDTTGASGNIRVITTTLPTTLRPKATVIGSVLFSSLGTITGSNAVVLMNTSGELYPVTNVSNAAYNNVAHNAGASRTMHIVMNYIIS